ncbi:MAG: PKD domain-containing protein [bacterium]
MYEVDPNARISVILDGSGSSDPNQDPLEYIWSGIFGTIEGVTGVIELSPGKYTINLTVSDGQLSSTDEIEVNVIEKQATPILSDSGLIQYTISGSIISRGTETAQFINLPFEYHGDMVDLEMKHGVFYVVNKAGDVFSSSGVLYSLNETNDPLLELDSNAVIDLELVTDVNGTVVGYYVLDQYGTVKAYGAAPYMGSASYIQELRFGRSITTYHIPMAVDLELVEQDVFNPTTGDTSRQVRGYYIVDQMGNFTSGGDVPALASASDLAPIMDAELDVDVASGTIKNTYVMNYLGIMASEQDNYTLTTPQIRLEHEPFLVDFEMVNGQFFIMNEYGHVFRSGVIDEAFNNEPIDNLIGMPIFVDMEFDHAKINQDETD